jgi:hypothetical protein
MDWNWAVLFNVYGSLVFVPANSKALRVNCAHAGSLLASGVLGFTGGKLVGPPEQLVYVPQYAPPGSVHGGVVGMVSGQYKNANTMRL